MPDFPRNPLENLALDLDASDVDQILELRDCDPATALLRVDELLCNTAAGASVAIRFDPPRGDGTETLFLPLGRHLLKARREGRLQTCLPASDGTGYLVRLAEP